MQVGSVKKAFHGVQSSLLVPPGYLLIQVEQYVEALHKKIHQIFEGHGLEIKDIQKEELVSLSDKKGTRLNIQGHAVNLHTLPHAIIELAMLTHANYFKNETDNVTHANGVTSGDFVIDIILPYELESK